MSSKSLPLRQLGKNGPMVPAMGFGLIPMSYETYGAVPSEEERFALLDRAVELGATFWDSADLYFDNEDLVGKWFKRTGKRDQIFLATKFGFVKGSKTYDVDSSAEYCKKCCESSLKALGVDCIDLYYLHNANPETPIEETMRAMVELQKEGKIKHIGLCAISGTTLRRAVKIAPVAAVQTEYSIFTRDIEGPAGTNLLDACRELGVAVVILTPLGRGLMTESFITQAPDGMNSKIHPRLQEANREHNLKIVSQFKAFADKKGCSVTQLALAWILKQGDDLIPIPGTKRVKYLEDNLAALDIVITDEENAELRAFAESVELAGPSQPAAFSHYLFRDTKEEST